MQASLALPSTGGAVRETFRASPSAPETALFLARGWTLTLKLAPPAMSWIGIMAIPLRLPASVTGCPLDTRAAQQASHWGRGNPWKHPHASHELPRPQWLACGAARVSSGQPVTE